MSKKINISLWIDSGYYRIFQTPKIEDFGYFLSYEWVYSMCIIDYEFSLLDETMQNLIDVDADEIDDKVGMTIGTTAVFLDASSCYQGECNMGNLMTKSYVTGVSQKNYSGTFNFYQIITIENNGIKNLRKTFKKD